LPSAIPLALCEKTEDRIMINARQVNVLRPNASRVYTTLDDYMNRRKVIRMPWVEAQEVAVAAADFVLVDSTTHLVAGVLTVLDASPPVTAITNGGICAAELVGAIGTAAITNYTDSLGNILNLVAIRDASTHDEILTSDGRKVFGLIQCANGVAEAASVGANASENTQISFVYIAADGTVTLATITATIEFQASKIYLEGQVPTIYLEGGNVDFMLLETPRIDPYVRKLVVTAQFAANEVITIAGGAGAGTGTSDDTGDTVTLDASEALFNANDQNRIRLNGVQLIRDDEVHWDSATTFHINYIMDINDVVEIEVPAS